LIYQTKSASRSDRRWMILNTFWVQILCTLHAACTPHQTKSASRSDRRWMILNTFWVQTSRSNRRWMILNTFWGQILGTLHAALQIKQKARVAPIGVG
jgi:hypothetical protein